MKIKKLLVLMMSALALLITSCESTDVGDEDPAVGRGADAWNYREPEAARAYWVEIEDAAKQKKYLNYITLYNAGNAALESTDGIKASNEGKLLSACNTALAKFSALPSFLNLPEDVKEKGANLTAGRIDNLLAAGKLADAKKMYKTASTVYGTNEALEKAEKQIDVCSSIEAKRSSLLSQASKAGEIEDFEEKVETYKSIIAKCSSEESAVSSLASNSGVGSTAGVSTNVKAFKKVRQDINIQLEGIYRDKVYEYKDKIGEEFARQLEGTGSGKNGAFTLDEILAHYKSVEKNIDATYAELLDFADKHKTNVHKDVLDDVEVQKKDLLAKIAQINREIANKKEIESRGKTVIPLMIGLFNPAPGSTKASQKSRPAKFSAAKQSDSEYWWGMVSIKKGEMNDLVITMKDNRNIRVFNQNTHSGKDIEKKGLKDLVSKANKVGNSWPVLNAAKALGSDKYFFEVQKGKTDSYSGEVVVYSSFITRSR